jgi:hypothetical protein
LLDVIEEITFTYMSTVFLADGRYKYRALYVGR